MTVRKSPSEPTKAQAMERAGKIVEKLLPGFNQRVKEQVARDQKTFQVESLSARTKVQAMEEAYQTGQKLTDNLNWRVREQTALQQKRGNTVLISDKLDLKTIIIIILLLILAGLIFDSSPPLPSNCHLTSPVDAGGQEIECD